MSYCSKCGKQNSDTAKFCTSCGGTLIAKQDSLPKNDYQKESQPIKENNINWVLIGSLVTLLVAVAVYFIFFNKVKKDTQVTNNNTEQKDTAKPLAPTVIDSDPVPLNSETTTVELTISKTEVDNISRRINEFYKYETEKDITNLLSYYRFPLDRYYQLYNVSYDKLHKMVVDAYNGKLYYHNINIKWNNSSV